MLAEGKPFRVLLASVTFYRAEVGDQVTVLLPAEGEAQWASIEAVLPKHVAEAAARSVVQNPGSTEADGEMQPRMAEVVVDPLADEEEPKKKVVRRKKEA